MPLFFFLIDLNTGKVKEPESIEGQSQAMIKDQSNSEYYIWGDQCQGWHLVQSKTLSVIEEIMPPGTAERRHFHRKAQQFFYILEGMASFEVAGTALEVEQGKGLTILPNQKHQVFNKGSQDLRFLVISQPTTRGDRVDL